MDEQKRQQEESEMNETPEYSFYRKSSKMKWVAQESGRRESCVR